MSQLLLLLVLGPAQTISGKYHQHADEYLKKYPSQVVALPATLPDKVDALCALIEAGHAKPQLYAALGEALLRSGDRALAYRAFHKAQRMQDAEVRQAKEEKRKPAWPLLDRNHLVARKDSSEFVSEKTIRDEEREARIWVDALQSYQRGAIRSKLDPRNLDPFYVRYGKPEDDLNRIIRTRRISFLGGVLGIFVGVAFAFRATRIRKRAAAIPLIVAGLSFAGPLILGFTGLLVLGGCFAVGGGLLVSARGR